MLNAEWKMLKFNLNDTFKCKGLMLTVKMYGKISVLNLNNKC